MQGNKQGYRVKGAEDSRHVHKSFLLYLGKRFSAKGLGFSINKFFTGDKALD